MSVTELLPTLQKLSRTEKLRVMQFLISELAREENEASLEHGAIYRIESPLTSHEAAHKLDQLLEEDKKGSND